jgi:hypothetical protein
VDEADVDCGIRTVVQNLHPVRERDDRAVVSAGAPP